MNRSNARRALVPCLLGLAALAACVVNLDFAYAVSARPVLFTATTNSIDSAIAIDFSQQPDIQAHKGSIQSLSLGAVDMTHYIQHRLSLAGGSGRPSFTKWALRAIHRGSGGVPRVVNNLCDKAMLSAFIRESDEVNFWDARRAVRDMQNLID